MITFIRAHKRLTVIIFLWVVFCGFFIIPNWHEGPEPLYFLVFSIGFLTLISAQLFWIGGILALGKRFISGKPRRVWLAIIVMGVYALFLAHNFGIGDRLLGGDSTHLTMRRLVVDGVWSVWLVGSWVGFGLVMVFWTVDRMTRTATWVYHKARNAASSHAAVPIPGPGAAASDPPSPARSRLLERTAAALSAAPFVAAGYGLLYGRFNVEVTRRTGSVVYTMDITLDRGGQQVLAINVDSMGKVYVVGNTDSSTFPTTDGSVCASRDWPSSCLGGSGYIGVIGPYAEASVSHKSVTFGTQLLSTTSEPKRITLFNSGTAQMTVSGLQISGDYSIQSNYCGNGVNPGTHCDVYVVFTPMEGGRREGSLTFTDNAASSPQVVTLKGHGHDREGHGHDREGQTPETFE